MLVQERSPQPTHFTAETNEQIAPIPGAEPGTLAGRLEKVTAERLERERLEGSTNAEIEKSRPLEIKLPPQVLGSTVERSESAPAPLSQANGGPEGKHRSEDKRPKLKLGQPEGGKHRGEADPVETAELERRKQEIELTEQKAEHQRLKQRTVREKLSEAYYNQYDKIADPIKDGWYSRRERRDIARREAFVRRGGRTFAEKSFDDTVDFFSGGHVTRRTVAGIGHGIKKVATGVKDKLSRDEKVERTPVHLTERRTARERVTNVSKAARTVATKSVAAVKNRVKSPRVQRNEAPSDNGQSKVAKGRDKLQVRLIMAQQSLGGYLANRGGGNSGRTEYMADREEDDNRRKRMAQLVFAAGGIAVFAVASKWGYDQLQDVFNGSDGLTAFNSGNTAGAGAADIDWGYDQLQDVFNGSDGLTAFNSGNTAGAGATDIDKFFDPNFNLSEGANQEPPVIVPGVELSEAPSRSLSLSEGSNIWELSEKALGRHASVHDTDAVKDAILQLNGWSEADAYQLQAGTNVSMPVELIERLKKAD